jgi:hypothetical protein
VVSFSVRKIIAVSFVNAMPLPTLVIKFFGRSCSLLGIVDESRHPTMTQQIMLAVVFVLREEWLSIKIHCVRVFETKIHCVGWPDSVEVFPVQWMIGYCFCFLLYLLVLICTSISQRAWSSRACQWQMTVFPSRAHRNRRQYNNQN